ncbi:hypothetical protein [Aquabacterium sp.]|uniref:hypothetical protein n=1 Tax=Aquabacterium sp. TaxID=1872578 RepID=UPI0037843D7E
MDNKEDKTPDLTADGARRAKRRPGRPATGKRPRLLLTIPPELDEVLTELSDRFEIGKATLLEKQAVLRAIPHLVEIADSAKAAALERDSNPHQWATVRWELLQPGPESLETTTRKIIRDMTAPVPTTGQITAADLDADDLRELKDWLQERRRTKAA